MEAIETVKIISELGSTAMLLFFLIVIWKEKKESGEKKDGRIKELSDSILDVVRENTQVQSELKASIRENTRASETLTARVREVLSNHGGKG